MEGRRGGGADRLSGTEVTKTAGAGRESGFGAAGAAPTPRRASTTPTGLVRQVTEVTSQAEGWSNEAR